MTGRRPYRQWLRENQSTLEMLAPAPENASEPAMGLRRRQHLFGYTQEDLKLILPPMINEAKEPTGSMGDDIPPAILSRRPRLLYDYFRQLFAQVTNPPLDAIREELVTSLNTYLGSEQNLLDESPE
ncbi:MAG: glutamate synthase central domain-containing protein, partial [Bacteroidales bacterium]